MGNKVLRKGTIEVDYEYLSSMQVKDLQRYVRDNCLWNILHWGSFGPNGDQDKKVNCLNDLSTDHLEAILITQPQIQPVHRVAIMELLRIRAHDSQHLNEEQIEDLAFEWATDYKPWQDDLDYREYAKYGFIQGYKQGRDKG